MWFWFLWLFNFLGLGGALTAWSIVELIIALGAIIYVIAQGIGIMVLLAWPVRSTRPTVEIQRPIVPPPFRLEERRTYHYRRRRNER
jgi:hypothetical protein